jgi:molybdate transport system regulatory protein
VGGRVGERAGAIQTGNALSFGNGFGDDPDMKDTGRKDRGERPPTRLRDLRLRIIVGPNVVIGPGKADILEAIDETGSISAAARSMAMSYRRAWLLVEGLNRSFRTPLVETLKGGRRGGGARLTALGETVLRRYRDMEDKAAKAVAGDLACLKRLLSRS